MDILPSQLYQEHARRHGLRPDPGQAAVLPLLDDTARTLRAAWARRRWWRRPEPAPGLYLHGPVGRGKTLLMNLLHEALADLPGGRWHFHAFMRHLHGALRALDGQRDPVERLARKLARRLHVLYVDEFQVEHIIDAMLLGRLLERLFAHGLALVATSNCAPGELYRDGLQRARFLPAIAAIERHCRVAAVDGGRDHRLLALRAAGVYHCPADERAEAQLARAFAELGAHGGCEHTPLEVNGRAIPVRARGEGVVWFDFDALCRGPRSQDDYLEIARDHHSVLVSAVPVLGPADDDAARRFLNLVDVLYDGRVKLLLSAATPPEGLYRGEHLRAAFARCTSRLLEMQSPDYLGRAHRV